METITIKRDRTGIDFYRGKAWFYGLARSQIKLHGRDYWLNHLRDKNWFDGAVEQQFLDYCQSIGE